MMMKVSAEAPYPDDAERAQPISFHRRTSSVTGRISAMSSCAAAQEAPSGRLRSQLEPEATQRFV